MFQVFNPIQDDLNLKPADSAGRRRVGRGGRGPDDLFAKVMLGQVLKARNAPDLTHADIETLTPWADGGAVEGNAADKPTALQWTDGWRIQPDVVVSMRGLTR